MNTQETLNAIQVLCQVVQVNKSYSSAELIPTEKVEPEIITTANKKILELIKAL